MKNNVNVASKSNKQKNLEDSEPDLASDPNPDPLARCTDPRIRTCTKMSRIRNTDAMFSKGGKSGQAWSIKIFHICLDLQETGKSKIWSFHNLHNLKVSIKTLNGLTVLPEEMPIAD